MLFKNQRMDAFVSHKFVKKSLATAVIMGLMVNSVSANTNENSEEEIVVTAEFSNPIGPDFGYVGENSMTATKTDMPISKTPRAVSVVTREQMDDRASVSVADALQYTPSIQANFYGEDNKQDWFVIRGFNQANDGLYQDGTRVDSSSFYSYQVDPFGLERVEILRGPASVLYGQNPPGGVINVISKRPQHGGSFGFVSVDYGTNDRQQLSLDLGSDITDDIAWRLVALGRKNGTDVDNVEAERIYLAPSVSVNFSDNTNLTVLASYQKDDSDPYLQFLPMEGSLTENENGFIGDDVAIGNPGYEKFERTQAALGYEFSHKFNESVQFAQSVRYSQLDIDLKQMYALGYAQDFGLEATRTNIVRGLSSEEGKSKSFSADNRLIYKFNTGKLEHTLLSGIDYRWLDIKGQSFGGRVLVADGNTPIKVPTPYPGIYLDTYNPLFNPYNPSYTDNVTLLNGTTFQPVTDADRETKTSEKHQLGGYLQEHMLINDRVAITLGVRFDDTKSTFENKSTSAKQVVSNQEWTKSAGVAYIFENGLTPYANYAEHFQPVLKLDKNGNSALPESGEQFEIGLKYLPQSFDGSFNAALFQINKENMATSDAAGNLLQIGEVENKGIELEAVANVTSGLSLVANATFMDSEIVKDNDASKVGNRPMQVANTLASAWANYRFFGNSLEGLAIGVGGRYVGETYADDTETTKVADFTLMDATVSYTINNMKIQIAAKNLMDKEYVSTCGYGNCFYGNGRNMIASLSYAW
ncbi:TonB-dependent siderophore receptor [Moritella viscosa]|uniref:TonB-dependent siderophore receptor subfamily n=1 Tax=Moritella viscosa TaxID=80854 RepID=A0ABY1H8Q0_9GAMM|nr:TonB-dependent siderophore receptor [Moritella viscosa]CED58662.1 TonB-dependent siderophore receptor [Moritella viscosa]SGY83061.1 TonB-dependent siderophore receptor subfamily [Moritella viscosa]SGY84209.1 TonB-dependent siderophore receptor subfamily [Moritella viscosa]SHN97320.1 TonB-dependent siderophore receptor subfamily [Moritella viscosa]SHN97321.1 TonB-dependent siderophore receptor subfamily [Moritella viscosa]